MVDNDFMPWSKVTTDRLAKEYEAKHDFVPAKYTHYPLSLDTKSTKKMTTLRNRVIQGKKFIPGKVFFPFGVNSFLTRREQAICLIVLKLYQSGQNLNNLTRLQQEYVELYKSLQSKIQEEHAKFLDYVKNDWQNCKFRFDSIKVSSFKFAIKMWEIKLQKSLRYPRFYNLYDDAQLVGDDTKHQPQVTLEQNVLSYGIPPVFTHPTLTSRCILRCKSLPRSEDNKYTYNSRLPVSRDYNVTKILQDHDVDIVISMSGIKRLMDDSNHNTIWNIPFIVKQYKCKSMNGNLVIKKIVYIDKPLPLQTPSYVEINEYCHKRLVHTELRIKTTENVQNSEETILSPYYISLHPNLNDVDTNFDEIEDDYQNLFKVNYAIWNMNKKSEESVLLKSRTENQNIRVLLRQKIAAYEDLPDGNKRDVILVPKLEYQVEYGANICTRHELVRQWADLFFRPYSHLYRVRTLNHNSEVVHVESVPLEKINMEAMYNYHYRPVERLNGLFTLFSRLMKLECGNYLLHHTSQTGIFAQILKETSDLTAQSRFDLYHEYDIKNCRVQSAKERPWCPIDVNYILEVHNVYKRLPGMFKPLLLKPKPKPKKGKKKKNKKAKKKAAKAQQNKQQTK